MQHCFDNVGFMTCCSYFIKLLLDKKYALPYRVLDAVVAHFMRFLEETRLMPVIWHQSLLTFVQRWAKFLKVSSLPKWGMSQGFLIFIYCLFHHIQFSVHHSCRYKNELQKEDKDNLRNLLEKQKHYLVGAFSLERV